MNSVANMNTFLEFKKQALAAYPTTDLEDFGIEESVFISATKIHYTLFVLRLETEAEIDLACKTLASSLETASWKTFPLKSDVLSCFPSKAKSASASVLFVEPEASSAHRQALESVTLAIATAFHEAQLLSTPEFQRLVDENTSRVKVNFHSTIMNSKYRRGGRKKAKRLDVTDLLRQHEQQASELTFTYNEAPVTHICLSSMQKPQDKETGYYYNEIKVPLLPSAP